MHEKNANALSKHHCRRLLQADVFVSRKQAALRRGERNIGSRQWSKSGTEAAAKKITQQFNPEQGTPTTYLADIKPTAVEWA